MERKKTFNRQVVGAMADNLGNSLRDMARCGHHRSKRATLVEMGLQLSGTKLTLATPKKLTQLIKECAQANEQPLQLPRNVKFDVATRLETAPCPLIRLNPQTPAKRVVVYLPGGAFIKRPTKEHWQFLNRLAKTADIEIVVPDYPLAPNHDFHAAYQMLSRLYEKLYAIYPASNIIFMGDSSGAGLAAGFCEWLGQKHLPQPGRLILFSPWVDVTMSNPLIKKYVLKDHLLNRKGLQKLGQLWAGETDLHDYRVSPLYGDKSQLRNVDVYIGTHDIMCPDEVEFVRQLKLAGIKTNGVFGRGLFHSYPLYQIPESKKIIADLARELAQPVL